MGVPATELRPRTALQLFDAAIRLCARSSGVWAVTLPASALVITALLNLLDRRGGSLAIAAMTLAWAVRAVSQTAACHFLELELLGKDRASVRKSYATALRHLPSALIAAGHNLVFNAVTLTFTLGFSVFFLSAHTVAYAAALHSGGSPFGVYAHCARLLGKARGAAGRVRSLFFVQALAIANLHVAVAAAIYLGRKVVGLDLVFAQRFVSLDNPSWLVTLVASGYLLFEPLRAATATLLLIDGRVRQEGLDLVSALDQLPRRRASTAAVAAALLLLLAPSLARATELDDRFAKIVATCPGEGDEDGLSAIGKLVDSNRAGLQRSLERAESLAYDDADCEGARGELDALYDAAKRTAAASTAAPVGLAKDHVRQILARPEFADTPEPEAEVKDAPPTPDAEAGWLERFFRWLGELLRKWFSGRAPRLDRPMNHPSGSGGAELVIVAASALAAVIIGALVYVLFTRRKPSARAGAELTSEALPTAMNEDDALSRRPEGWAALADELAKNGRFREAIRSLYLALLSTLHAKGAIDYDPTRSNWEYFHAFKGPGGWLAPFRELTRRFDYAWYGNLAADDAAYREFRLLTAPLLDEEASAADA